MLIAVTVMGFIGAIAYAKYLTFVNQNLWGNTIQSLMRIALLQVNLFNQKVPIQQL
jgi:hypothetical protein